MANYFGLILGATGSEKTVTLQGLTEGFSNASVSVIVADVKGDLTGLTTPQDPTKHNPLPVRFLDVFGAQGHPLSISIEDMGPAPLSRHLNLTEAQEGTLNIAFRLARKSGLPINGLNALRSLLAQIELRREEIQEDIGTVPASSLNAIRRRLLILEEEGATGRFSHNGCDEPPRVYRRVFGSSVRLLFPRRSRLDGSSPLLPVA